MAARVPASRESTCVKVDSTSATNAQRAPFKHGLGSYNASERDVEARYPSAIRETLRCVWGVHPMRCSTWGA